MADNQICLVIVYFGKFPKWVFFFLKSCELNSNIHFILFTDQLESDNVGNLQIVNLDLATFCKKASEKIGLTIEFRDPYKICDFRPAFGLIFEDYIFKYRYWGYCDIDLIFGDIWSFIREPIEADYDIISGRREYLTGSFTLYRNCDKTKYLFRESKDYVFVFKSSQNHVFDECNFLWWELISGKSIFDLPSTVESMTHVVRRLELQKSIRAYFETNIIEQDRRDTVNKLLPLINDLKWSDGVLSDIKRSYLLFHFHFLKHSPSFFISPVQGDVPTLFFMGNRGIWVDTLDCEV